MPFHQLCVSPVDVAGARLRLALNAPAPAPLVSWQLVHPDGSILKLGVLGASHVITVEHPLADGFSEQVSCTADTQAGELPQTANAPGYQLHSQITFYDELPFRQLASQLRERCESGTQWLGGAFPGDDAALTVLNAAPAERGWRWRTWHLYPHERGGSAVYTASRWWT
jgi:hypothetical protein